MSPAPPGPPGTSPALPDGAPPPAHPREPSQRVPAGAWDAHIHVFGDQARYPLWPTRGYTPHVCTLAQYRELMAALGIARAVLVQPSVYGTDNSALLDTLRVAGPEWRGVVVPPPDIDDASLRRMHDLGVRGFRLNLVNPAVLSLDAAIALARRVRPLRWHLDLQVDLSSPAGERQLAACDALGLPVVVDHLGLADSVQALQPLVRRLERGSCWVKISGLYRLRAESATITGMVRTVLGANPARVLCGTDWPHTELQRTVHAADWLDTVTRCIDATSIRTQLFVANPAAFYGA